MQQPGFLALGRGDARPAVTETQCSLRHLRISFRATGIQGPALRRVGQSRIDKDTPSLAAITVVAPGVRFNAFAIFVTPSFAFAIVFIWRFSPAVHARRTLFLAFAIFTLSDVGQA
jgi:hypothetical protein